MTVFTTCLVCVIGMFIGLFATLFIHGGTKNVDDNLEVKIKYFDDSIEKIKKFNYGDWIDLRAEQDLEFYKGDFKMIPLNVAMELPFGYEAHVAPRSSTFKNYGIVQTNSFGIIDNSYSGSGDRWYMPAYCLEPRHGQVTRINKGDRVCQFRIVKSQPALFFNESELSDKNRGGFGSTGVK